MTPFSDTMKKIGNWESKPDCSQGAWRNRKNLLDTFHITYDGSSGHTDQCGTSQADHHTTNIHCVNIYSHYRICFKCLYAN